MYRPPQGRGQSGPGGTEATFYPGGTDDFYMPDVISPSPQRCVFLFALFLPVCLSANRPKSNA
jgi:hypothetical protein